MIVLGNVWDRVYTAGANRDKEARYMIYSFIFILGEVLYCIDMAQNRALIIEDDDRIFDLISMHLLDLGFETEHAKDGLLGLQKALEKEYNLIVLDLMLPKLDGFEVCKRIRDKNKQVPLLMLTARSEELDKVLGLELGADDYITKPFGIREFIARVKALMRRIEVDQRRGMAGTGLEILRYGSLVINCTNRTVHVDERPLDLTNKEYELLELLARNPGRAFNREQLLEAVWGYQYEGYNHTVNSHINRLRSKIEDDPANPKYVQTMWGYVHMFVYDTGRDLMSKGVITAETMLPEVAYIKLGWALGQTSDLEKVKEIMLSPINDEITPREPYNGYLIYQGGVPEVEEFIRKFHK